MIMKTAFVALLAGVLALILSEYGYRGKRLFSVFVIVSLIGVGVFAFSRAVNGIDAVISLTGLGDAATCAIKIVGTGYVFGITADVCREMGEAGIANALTTVGRLEIFVTVLPYILKMVELGTNMIK